MTAALHGQARPRALLAAPMLAICCASASAEDRRDIVFDCPCTAEWVADGEAGVLTVQAAFRSYRFTESGEVRLSSRWWEGRDGANVGLLPPMASVAGEWTIRMSKPDAKSVIKLHLLEESAQDSDGNPKWHRHEALALWPVPRDGGENEEGNVSLVDILTDSDGDGIGDVNERLAGSDWEDPESLPGESTIDVLALYTAAFREGEGSYPYTRVLHALSVSSALLEDSGINIHLRMIGMSEVELGESGWAKQDAREELMDSHGADLSIQFSPRGPCTAGGCAEVGVARSSHWTDAQVWSRGVSAGITAHELGHAMGLAHSYRQGEVYGAWRWSRGHYVTPRDQRPRKGTIMAYGLEIHGGVFSDPLADCGAGPCGVYPDQVDGADSVTTLNALRFQIAAHRTASADKDGDGIVDASDVAPEDPTDWFDIDGDGTGDNSDPDDDNDGVDDIDDAFPLDRNEWADADLDGIGDNADGDVRDLGAADRIRDPALLRAVETAIGKAPDNPITAEDIAGLTYLHAEFDNIQDLTGLELATGLERLWLTGNHIRDLTPLSKLDSLRELYLGDNEIANLAPLSRLSKLYRLVLSLNPVSDIGALSGLTGLRELFLSHTDAAYADVLALPYFHRLEALGLAELGIRDVSALTELPLRELDLSGNRISNANPISALTGLRKLSLTDNHLMEIGFLEEMTELYSLKLSDNAIVDIGPLTELVGLTDLDLHRNNIVDISGLSAMTELYTLNLRDNTIRDIGPLSGLVNLTWLDLAENDLADVSALSTITELRRLLLSGNSIVDIKPLAQLDKLTWLDLANNYLADVSALSTITELHSLILSDNAIRDIGSLAQLDKLTRLDLANNDLTDVSALSTLTELRTLVLSGNSIVDIKPLAELDKLTWLDLANNRVSNIGPLVEGSIVDGMATASNNSLNLDGNPLDATSVEVHIPKLRSEGVSARFTRRGSSVRPTSIADPTLRSLVGEELAVWGLHVDDPIRRWPMDQLLELRLHGAQIRDFTGLEAAANLERLYAGSNGVEDLSPLAGLTALSELDLRNNRVSNLGPLVENANLGDGDWVNLGGNPLSEESINEHIPALLERGVRLSVSPVQITHIAGGETLRLKVSGYFKALLGEGFTLRVSEDNAAAAAVNVTDGVLVIEPYASGSSGKANVTITARGGDGRTETLSFVVTFRGPAIIPLFPSDSGVRQGLVRVINRTGRTAQAQIVATDDSGLRSSSMTLTIAEGETVHLNATDLEAGNPDKGLSGSIGRGTGDWRLELSSADQLDVLPFARAGDGSMTTLHDVVAVSGSAYRVPIFNPASDLEQVSSLRLVNEGTEAAEAFITGVDDLGQSPGGEVRVEVPAGKAVSVTAAELEGGAPGLRGQLGDGTGRWRLEIRSEADLVVMNLLSSPEGHLANLSGDGVETQDNDVHVVPLLLSAADPLGRRGLARVINRSEQDGIVHINAYDDEGFAYGPLELSLGAGQAAHFNSQDLEVGNADKKLSGNTGPGVGDWRMELSSELDIQVLAFVRTSGGFLTPVDEGVPQAGRRHEVETFNAADNPEQSSKLRIVNPGSRPAHVAITGIDDKGGSPGEVVRMSIPAGQSRTVTAAQLEAGFWGSQGALGDGTGAWRLIVDCEQPIIVMNLLEGVTGQIANLSQ